MNKDFDIVYEKLHKIYKKYQSKYRHNPDSKQMCCMWSTYNPPDTLSDTKQIYDIEKELEITLTEDEAIELYNMHLDEAARRIIEIQKINANQPHTPEAKKRRG